MANPSESSLAGLTLVVVLGDDEVLQRCGVGVRGLLEETVEQ